MNIEKSTEILKVFKKYNKFYKEENKDLTITITLEAKENIDKAIETLLTAYEKEKEKNKELSDKLTEKICKGVEEEILEEYRQIIIDKDKLIEELKKYKKKDKK